MAGYTSSRVGTSSNLQTNGTYDLLLLSYPEGFPNTQLGFEFTDEPRKITGLEKVVQIFLKVLFTTAGSDPVYPSRGTQMNNLTVNANVLTSNAVLQSDIIAAVNSAASQTIGILNTDGSDPSSQLSSVTVLGMDVGNQAVVMYLQFLTPNGISASIALPFPELDLAVNG